MHFKFELKFNAQILLPSSLNPHRFYANRGLKNSPRQISTKQGSLTKIRVKFFIIPFKFKLLKLILMYNISLRKIIKISNLRSKKWTR